MAENDKFICPIFRLDRTNLPQGLHRSQVTMDETVTKLLMRCRLGSGGGGGG